MLKLDDISGLKGGFLIASPAMSDLRFVKSVLFMCESKVSGSFGFTIDRKENLPKFKKQLKNTIFAGENVYSGGPVAENRLFIVHSSEVTWPETLRIGHEICVTNFEDAVKSGEEKPQKCLILAGYTSWIANQLEREILMGLWLMVPCCPEMLFEKSSKNQWKLQMKKLDLNENTFSLQVGTS